MKSENICETEVILRELVYKRCFKQIWIGFLTLVKNFRCAKMSYFLFYGGQIRFGGRKRVDLDA